MPGGKYTRSLILIKAYELLVPKEQRTEENIKLSSLLGWMIELVGMETPDSRTAVKLQRYFAPQFILQLQSFFLTVDDVMDFGATRRGKPCWYLKKNIGLGAVNDALAMKEAIYYFLRTHFGHLDCCTKIVELFHEVST